MRQNTPDGNLFFQQANVLRDLDVGVSKVVENSAVSALKEQLRDELAQAERELWVSSSAADQCQQKMQTYPQLRQKLSKMHMEYKEKSLSKLGEVEVLRRLLIECEQP